MAKFNGIAIADPSKKDCNFTTNEGFRQSIEGLKGGKNLKSTVVVGVTSSVIIPAHYIRTLKDHQNPHITHGDQEIFLKGKHDYESSKGFRVVKEVTIPVTNPLKTSIEEDRVYAKNNEKQADVEKPVLETGKVLTDLNGAGYYDPGLKEKKSYTHFDPKVHVTNAVQKLGRPKTNSPTLMTDPNSYAKEKNYLHKNGKGSFLPMFYTRNPWVDVDTGRVSLFEKPRETSRII
jgi:hypothetical protein